MRAFVGAVMKALDDIDVSPVDRREGTRLLLSVLEGPLFVRRQRLAQGFRYPRTQLRRGVQGEQSHRGGSRAETPAVSRRPNVRRLAHGSSLRPRQLSSGDDRPGAGFRN